MYKLREERLKTLYAEPTQAESKGFNTSGGHTDSFADQCFQSIKSKEVRDSESPTRDYHYKVQGNFSILNNLLLFYYVSIF